MTVNQDAFLVSKRPLIIAHESHHSRIKEATDVLRTALSLLGKEHRHTQLKPALLSETHLNRDLFFHDQFHIHLSGRSSSRHRNGSGIQSKLFRSRLKFQGLFIESIVNILLIKQGLFFMEAG